MKADDQKRKSDRTDNAIPDRLQRFAIFTALPYNYLEHAQYAWKLTEPEIYGILNYFYDFIGECKVVATPDDIKRDQLIIRQYDHLKTLFNDAYSDKYFSDIRRIGVEHINSNSSPSCYTSCIGFLSTNITQHINSVLSDNPNMVLDLTQTTNTLLLIDMSLVLSIYNDEITLLD